MPWEMNWANSEQPATPVAPKNSALDSAIEGYKSGAGVGFRDEIYAASEASGLPRALGGFRAPVGAAMLAKEYLTGEPGDASKTYDTALEEVRARENAAREDNPGAFTVGEIGGSLVPASRVAKFATGAASLGGAIVRSAIAGAGLGGIEGFGRGEDGPANRLESGGEGAIVGTVAGAAAPVAGEAIGRGVNALINRAGASGAGAGNVIKALERDGMSPSDVPAALRQAGPDAMIADLGPNLTQQAATIAATPGPGQQTIRSALNARNAGASDRVNSAVDAAMGGRVNIGQLERDLVERRRNAAAPLYDLAYSRPLPPSSEIADVLATPAGKLAASRAAKLSANEGIQFEPNSVRGVDLIKRTLDDAVSVGLRSGRNNEARVIGQLRDKLVQAADDAVPEYAMARRAFAGETAIKDAMSSGRELFKDSVTPESIRETLSRLTPSEADAYLQGARSSIQTIMGTARNDASRVRQLLQKGFNREKLEEVLGPDEAQRLFKSVGFETTAANTSQRVLGNSETAARVAGREDLTPSRQGLGIRDAYAAGGLMGAARSAGLRLIDAGIDAVRSGRQKQIESAMADILTLSGPDRDKAVAAVMREALRRDRSGTLARHVRSLATGAGLAGTAPHAPAIGAGAADLALGR
jgi:hypothetical protein